MKEYLGTALGFLAVMAGILLVAAFGTGRFCERWRK